MYGCLMLNIINLGNILEEKGEYFYMNIQNFSPPWDTTIDNSNNCIKNNKW